MNGENIKLIMDGKTELKKTLNSRKMARLTFNTLSDSEVDDLTKEIEDKLQDLGEDLAKDIQ